MMERPDLEAMGIAAGRGDALKRACCRIVDGTIDRDGFGWRRDTIPVVAESPA